MICLRLLHFNLIKNCLSNQMQLYDMMNIRMEGFKLSRHYLEISYIATFHHLVDNTIHMLIWMRERCMGMYDFHREKPEGVQDPNFPWWVHKITTKMQAKPTNDSKMPLVQPTCPEKI